MSKAKKIDRAYLKVEDRVRLLVLNETFQKGVKRIRKSFGIPTEGFDTASSEVNIWRDELSMTQRKKFEERVRKLRKKMKFNSSYSHFFEDYVVSNDIASVTTQARLTTRYDYEEAENGLFIQIYPETKLDDVIYAFDRAKGYRKRMWGVDNDERDKSLENFERDTRILKLHRAGVDAKTIAKVISEREQKSYNYADIKTILTRFEERIKNP